MKTKSSTSILTPRVRRAQHELIAALSESVAASKLSADQAQGKLSGVIADIWNEADRAVRSVTSAATE